MAKYKLKSLSVNIGGVVHHKSEGTIFDTDGKYKPLKSEIEACEKSGFFVKIRDTQKEIKNTEQKEQIKKSKK